jgi:hypothetical protein
MNNQTPAYGHFFTWALPGIKPEEVKKEAEAKHIALGNSLAQKIPGMVRTANAVDPTEPGSAWKADGDQSKALGDALRLMGYRQKGKGVWFRMPYQVDIGVDDGTTYIYITDDNNKPVRAKERAYRGRSKS